MAEKVTVWDGDGRKCVVDPIDAKEIVEQGGSWSDPAVKAAKVAEAAEIETHPVTIHNNEDKPKEFGAGFRATKTPAKPKVK